jgi:hypothetical protein
MEGLHFRSSGSGRNGRMALSAGRRFVGGRKLGDILTQGSPASLKLESGAQIVKPTPGTKFRKPQRGTFVRLLFRLLLADTAGGTPWPMGL